VRSNYNAVLLWDVASGQALATLKGHTDSVTSVAWSPDSRRLASGCDSGDSTVRLWEGASAKLLATLTGHEGVEQYKRGVSAVAWSSDGRLASTGSDGTLRLWDGVNGKSLAILKIDNYSVRAFAWSPDGRRIATTCGGLCVWWVGAG
jgi:WD40 repeat protein